MEAIEKQRWDRVMSQKEVEVTRLTSVQLLDAAIWREIGTEEPQLAPAFLEALSALVGRWLIARSIGHARDGCSHCDLSVSNATLFANAGWFRKIKCKHGNAMCKWQRKLVRGTSWRARAWGQHVSFQKHPLKTWTSLLVGIG